MNEAELGAEADELGKLVGAPFQDLWQPARDRVVLGLGDGTLLLIVPRGPAARLHTVASRPKNPPRPFSFQGACRAHLRGPLGAVEKLPGERVVRLVFGATALELRLTGRSGGLWLVEGEAVLAAYDGPAPPALPPLPEHPPRPDAPRYAPGPDGSWDLAARLFFSHAERDRERAERIGRLETSLARAIARGRRLLANLGDDLIKAEEAPALRHRADLLAANLYKAERGADAVDAEDWETGATVRIPLDAGRPASSTLERLYRQAKRLERVTDRVLERMETVEADLRDWIAARERLDRLPDDALAELEAKLPKSEGRPRPPSALPFLTWTGPRGERVLVGRNEAGNRRLVFQVAKGHDWWMHLRERPAAHVVIPVAKGASPPLELLLAAAQIALATAKLEPGEAAEVQYTRIRDVKPIPGEGARVTVANEKVLRVVRDPAALVGWITTEPG